MAIEQTIADAATAPAVSPAPVDHVRGRRRGVMSLDGLGRPRRIGRGYSLFVRSMRVILPLLALGLVLLVVLWPNLWESEAGGLAAPEQLAAGAGGNRMMGPRYFGVDSQNRPYSVVGRSSDQAGLDAGVVVLAAPEAEITLENGSWLVVRADQGELDRERKRVTLRGQVNVFRDDGYMFSTEEAFIDLESRFTWGDRPVSGHGPRGEIAAEGFRIVGQGSTVVFTGRSRLLLRRSEAAEAQP